MATWTDTATIKAGVTSGKPIIGTGGFGDQAADNLQYLKDIVDQIGIASDSAIHDDFTEDTLSIQGTLPAGTEEPYTWELGGTTVPAIAANPNHYLTASSNAGYSAIAASVYRMRFDLSVDHTVVYECRHKSSTSDNTDVWAFGFQDASLVIGAATIITTQNNFLGFVQGATANTYKAITSAGGVTTTVATNQGNAANWTELQVVVTFSGATQNVEFFMDGSSIGTSTSNISVQRMRPIFGRSGGGGVRTQHADWIHAYWRSRPKNA